MPWVGVVNFTNILLKCKFRYLNNLSLDTFSSGNSKFPEQVDVRALSATGTYNS